MGVILVLVILTSVSNADIYEQLFISHLPWELKKIQLFLNFAYSLHRHCHSSDTLLLLNVKLTL